MPTHTHYHAATGAEKTGAEKTEAEKTEAEHRTPPTTNAARYTLTTDTRCCRIRITGHRQDATAHHPGHEPHPRRRP